MDAAGSLTGTAHSLQLTGDLSRSDKIVKNQAVSPASAANRSLRVPKWCCVVNRSAAVWSASDVIENPRARCNRSPLDQRWGKFFKRCGAQRQAGSQSVKGEAEHAPSPLQQEPIRPKVGKILQAVWSRATE